MQLARGGGKDNLGTGDEAQDSPLRLWPEHSPAGIPSPLRSHHVMTGEALRSAESLLFNHPERQELQHCFRDVRGRRHDLLVDSLRDGLAGKRSSEGVTPNKPSWKRLAEPAGGTRAPAPGQPPTLGSQEGSQPWASESLPPSLPSLCSCQREINYICFHL